MTAVRLARVATEAGPRAALIAADGAAWIDLGTGDDPLAADDAAIARARTDGEARPLDPRALLVPLARPGAVYGVGLNYADHARETGREPPPIPPVFMKPANALAAPSARVPVPAEDATFDYEGELAVVVGRRLHRGDLAEAAAAVFGYAVACDFTLRSLARPDTLPLGKGMAGSTPLGPWITRADGVADPQALSIRTRVDGALRQDGTTADMIHGVVALIHRLARTLTLERGDVILTGSPAGSGVGSKPPRFLAAGARVRVEISGDGVDLGAIDAVLTAPHDAARPGVDAVMARV